MMVYRAYGVGLSDNATVFFVFFVGGGGGLGLRGPLARGPCLGGLVWAGTWPRVHKV